MFEWPHFCYVHSSSTVIPTSVTAAWGLLLSQSQEESTGLFIADVIELTS